MMSTLFVLSEQPSIAHHFLADVRSLEKQRDRRLFWESMERLGYLLAYELSKQLRYEWVTVTTPLGTKQHYCLSSPLVLGVILRAAIPLYEGVRRMFPEADTAFVGEYRKEGSEKKGAAGVEIEQFYAATPSLSGRTLILIDPMLATGKSIVTAYRALTDKGGTPQALHIISVIAARQGVEYVQKHLPGVHCWTADLDPALNDKAYIVPGLGDAGDLAFGEKL
ncbi:uracil phosphoribosyltransferase [Thermonema lapsum]|uniref:Uracil phosphoribosyltransferase n=1 Tax=Thermonema lapsum TaxID=28195 RepID=A0A846MSE5_9BACT|nr:uracil phosphoribosyltransferase [Thermonema lapsum]NIK74534.1 uracil phosphoribosyltransferase [Thermonema lapsum]